MAHTRKFSVAKGRADRIAKSTGKDVQVVRAGSGYYYGTYPNADPEALSYVAKATEQRN